MLIELTDSSLAYACEANYRAFLMFNIETAGGEIFHEAGVWWGIHTHQLGYSGTYRLISFPENPLELQPALEDFVRRESNTVDIQTGPATGGDEMRRHFKAWGATYGFGGLGMACDLADLKTDFTLPHGVNVFHLEDSAVFETHGHPYYTDTEPDNHERMKRLTIERMKHPDFHVMVATHEDQLVGITCIYVAEGVGGLYDVGVISDYRHKGIASVLVSRACQFLRHELGYKAAILHNRPGLIKLYGGVGFRVVTHLEYWECRLDKPLPSAEEQRNRLRSVTLDLEDLLVALGTEQLDKASKLIQAKPDLAQQFTSDDKTTPLHIAAWNGYVEPARALIAAGAPLEAVEEEFGCTPLFWAAHGYSINTSNQLEVAKLLLEAGANPATSNKWEESILQIASNGPDTQMTNLLERYQTD